MIVDRPTMADDQLHSSLHVPLPPGPEITTTTCRENDHADISDCSSETSSSEHMPSPCHPAVLANKKLGIVQAVRMFGGVIIGAAAEEISRTWCREPNHQAFSAGDSSGGGDSSLHSGDDPFAEPFDLSSPSRSLQRRSEDFFQDCKENGAQENAARVRRGDGNGSFQKRPVPGLKRKLSTLVNDDPPSGRLITGDATPRAPGGRAAVRAKAAGQGCTSFVSECSLPTDRGVFRLRAYRYSGSAKSHEPVVMVAGKIRGRENVPVRVHDQCQTSEVFGSKRCDCREQLDMSLRYIQENGGGAVIYLAQEGRGIGLANKVAAYALQDDGLDTVDANRQLGFKDDQRSYECVDFILRDMGVKSVQLMTNNPFKIDWLRATGVNVAGRIPVQVASNEHNHGYLEAKAARMSHLINNL